MSKVPTFDTAAGGDIWALPALTLDQVRRLPVSCPLAYAARACGIGRTIAMGMVGQDGHLVYMGQRIKVHKVGREWRVALPDLIRVLGIVEPAPVSG